MPIETGDKLKIFFYNVIVNSKKSKLNVFGTQEKQ